MQIDFHTADLESPEGVRVTGSVGLIGGRAVPLNEYTSRFLADWNVVKPGDPQRLLTADDGLEYLQAIPYNLRATYSWAVWNHIGLDEHGLEASLDRLRRPPSQSTVDRSLPVLFFGDFLTARAVTVALNPSDQEYLDKSGLLLTGPRQRFPTLDTYVRAARPDLTDTDCLDAISWMRGYFLPGRPVYRYFSHLSRFLGGAGYGYQDGSAAHLDLVQEATRPVWRHLPLAERDGLLAQDLSFLAMQLRSRPLKAVFCNGRFVSDTLKQHFPVKETASGKHGKLRWWVGRLDLDERSVPAAGWNYPLNQATGLTSDGESDFGRLIADTSRSHP